MTKHTGLCNKVYTKFRKGLNIACLGQWRAIRKENSNTRAIFCTTLYSQRGLQGRLVGADGREPRHGGLDNKKRSAHIHLHQRSPEGGSYFIPVFQRSRIQEILMITGSYRISSRSFYRIVELLLLLFIGSFLGKRSFCLKRCSC